MTRNITYTSWLNKVHHPESFNVENPLHRHSCPVCSDFNKIKKTYPHDFEIIRKSSWFPLPYDTKTYVYLSF